MKLQSSLEYLSTFSMALIVVTVVIAIVGVVWYALLSPKQSTLLPSSCILSTQLNCFQFAVGNNGAKSVAAVVFTNNLGQPIYFPQNAFEVLPTTANSAFYGACLPANAPQGATVVCNVTLSGYNPPIGTQLAPRFQVSYGECSAGQCTNLSTFGSGTTYVSSQLPFEGVTVLTFPSGGTVDVNGADYPDGSLLSWVRSTPYHVTATPPSSFSGHALEGWVTSGGVNVSSATSAQTTANTTAAGTLEADFVCYTLSVSTALGSGTTSVAPSSTGNCPQGSYLPGTPVTISAAPAPTWSFQSWTGTGTISYTGSDPTAQITMNSNVTELAEYYSTTVSTIPTVSTMPSGYIIPPSTVFVLSSPTIAGQPPPASDSCSYTCPTNEGGGVITWSCPPWPSTSSSGGASPCGTSVDTCYTGTASNASATSCGPYVGPAPTPAPGTSALFCSGSQSVSDIQPGGSATFYVSTAGSSGSDGTLNSCVWSFPCSSPGSSGGVTCGSTSCSGSSGSVSASFATAGTYSGTATFKDTKGESCSVPYSITVSSSAPTCYYLNIQAAHSSITYSPSSSSGCGTLHYTKGTVVSVYTAVDYGSGFNFGSWTCSGTNCYSGNAQIFTVTFGNSDITETASYTAAGTSQCSASCPSGESGSITWSCPGSGNCGTSSDTCSTGSATSLSNTCSAPSCPYYLNIQAAHSSISYAPTSSPGCSNLHYASGTEVAIDTSTDAGYSLTGWAGTGTISYSDTTGKSGYIVTMDSNITETASYTSALTCYPVSVIAPYSTVTFPQTSCSTAHSYPSGSRINITTTLDPGYGQGQWSCSSSGSCYTGTSSDIPLTVTAAVTETASYTETLNVANLVASPCLSVTPSGIGTYTLGSPVLISATPQSGYTVVWTGTGAGSYTGNKQQASVTMDSAITESASCIPNPYTLQTYNNGCTSISPSQGTYYETPQASVPLSATVPSGYSFQGWSGSGSGSYTGTSQSHTITMNGDITETATCSLAGVPKSYTLTMNPGTCSATSPSSGSHSYTSGTVVSISASVPSGDTFSGWSGSGSGSYSGSTNGAAVSMNGDITETASCNTPTLACKGTQSATSISPGQSVTFSTTLNSGVLSPSGCNWLFPCGGGGSCGTISCSGSSSSVTATFNNAGSFQGNAYFTTDTGAQCTVPFSVTVASSVTSSCVPTAGTDTCNAPGPGQYGVGHYYESDANPSECSTPVQEITTQCYETTGGSYEWVLNGPFDSGAEQSTDNCGGIVDTSLSPEPSWC